MKRVYQYLKLAGISGLFCLFLAADANAQRGGGNASGGGGGGGGRSGGGGSSGGGGGSFSRGGGGGGGFSGGNSGGSFSRGGGNFGSSRQPAATFDNRSSNSFRPNAVAPQSAPRGSQHSAPLSFNRGGVGSPNRGGYGNAYRGGSNYRGGYGSIRGGFYRGGRYYPGGYGSRFYTPGYAYRYSPWYRSGGYYYNRGFYGSLYYPRLGFNVGVLPFGYYPFNWGSNNFFYSDGFFYQYNNNQYTVVEPPLGAAVNALPKNAQAITINGQQFYEANGVYYTPVTKDDGTIVYQVAGKDGQLDTYSSAENGYDIVNDGYRGRQEDSAPAIANLPQVGDLVYSLPADTRKIKLNGELYYVSPDDIYFQEVRDGNGNKAYKVTATPEDPAN